MTDDALSEEWMDAAPESDAERRAAEQRAAAFFSQKPEYLGYWLELYREAEELSVAALARHLRCEVEVLPRLAICFRPRAEKLWDDTLRLAERFGVNQDALCDVYLEAETLAAERGAPPGIAGPSHARAPAPGTVFAAASDREEEDEGPAEGPETPSEDEDGR